MFNPWVGKIHREENGYPLQYSCLESSIDREAWQATVHVVTKRWTQLTQLSSSNSSSRISKKLLILNVFVVVHSLRFAKVYVLFIDEAIAKCF